MTPAVRNTVVLALFWVILFSVAWGVVGVRQGRELERWREREAALDAEIARAAANAVSFGNMDGQERTRAQEEVLAALDQRSEQPLFEYMRTLLVEDARPLRFHFEELQTGKDGTHAYRRYSLKGEGETKAVYRLLWEIETGERMLQAESIQLKELPAERAENSKSGVSFDVVIRAYELADGRPVFAPQAARETRVANATPFDPFKPLITATLPPNSRDLLEVDRSTLRALTSEVAYFMDQKNRLKTLKQGDQVYLGYLTRIIPERRMVEFTLDRGGTVERVTLSLEVRE